MKKYLGLNNLGNTCYMNSLLQSLFMTHPFRDELFKWEFDGSLEPEDSIPLQLQLLFAKLQTLDTVESIDARKLVKSFQWDPQESFAQHDVQEFCRVLFDAIQQSTDNDFIRDLYESQLESYVHCRKCNKESVRTDIVMDLSLSVKSYNVYNESLEKAMKYYLKPEELDGNNLYFCENCQEKVEATKGLRLKTLGKILCLQINRFDFDYETLERKKINNYVSYPYILDMNNFLKSYDNIVVHEDKQLLEEIEKLQNIQATQQPEFDDPLRRKRNRYQNRQPSPDQNNSKKQKVTFQDDTQQVIDDLRKSQQQLNKNAHFITTNNSTNQQFDEAYDLENDLLFGTEMKEMGDISTADGFQPQQQTQSIDVDQFDQSAQIQRDIQQYLQNGPYVYELYSVMIHSGGALGGHYYSYIKSFENDLWYCFNDSTVDRISFSQVTKMFGDKVPKYNSGVSAYFLMYRRVDVEQKALPTLNKKLQEFLEEDILEEKKRQEKLERERREKANELRIRCFCNNTDIILKTNKNYTLSQLKDQIHAEFDVVESPENTRIRFYSYFDKYKQETFTGKENQTLLELHFNEYKAILLETKQSHEVFEDYDPTMLMFKINTWRPSIQSLDESHLKPTQILINDKSTLNDLKELLKSKFGYDDVTIIKGTKFCFEILKGNDKLLASDLKLSNCSNLYVEQAEDQVKWLQEFDMDKYRCTIVFNDPRKAIFHDVPDYNFELQVDSRKTMLELKQQVADILGLDLEEFIVKRGSRFNQEVKDLSKAIRDNGILGRGTLFLQVGKPSAQGQYKLNFFIGGISKQYADSIEYDYDELEQLTISTDQTIFQLKEYLAKRFAHLELDPLKFRLREKINIKLGQIYHNEKEMKSYRFYDRQTLVIERLDQEEVTQSGQLLLYVKFFDYLQLQFPASEFFITADTTFDELDQKLKEKFPEIAGFEACKINNIYSFSVDDLIISCYDWQELKQNSNQIGKAPWFIQRDGNFIVVRDKTKVPNDLGVIRQQMKENRMQKMGLKGQGVTFSVDNGNKSQQQVNRPKEKALQIKVVKKQQHQQPQQEQQNDNQQ